MTNKEILQADLLDILFEKRNKDYGAYALRRGYDRRLLTAVGTAMSVILLFILINAVSKKNISAAAPSTTNERMVEITEVKMPIEKPKEPDKPKTTIKAVKKTATVEFVNKIVIKPNDQVKNKVPDIASIDGKKISDITQQGPVDNGTPKIIDKPDSVSGVGITTTPVQTQPDFIANERQPEFPGGPEALKRFLATNLTTPENLDDGEKKTVQIRFKVDKDGTVNTFEIVTSGGSEFDKEVVRVCKKMPHWRPAIQNGINVPVNYVLPVTFIGVEQ